jgi:hypothetical protein
MSTKFVGETIYVKCESLIKNQEVTGIKSVWVLRVIEEVHHNFINFLAAVVMV